MGVPAFFRWLSRKYPSIVVPCQEEKSQVIDGYQVPVDATQPNPNDVEFDNLYLDMNGIIHPCCHPEDKPAPKDEDEMMVAIFEYIDRIFNIVRPRRVLYMAIDGVAPRAKMNQQRSRRFRASKESSEKIEEIARIREGLESRGCQLPPMKPKDSHFDSNCITPGTEFMARLAVCLQYYIHDRMNNNPAWQNISVILSDANVPGEGEHKIMDFIRRQRSQPDHDPNTHHCLYGADADLIMLGLATHEPYFTILREEFKPGQPRPCEICGQIGHEMKECTGEAKEKEGEFDEMAKTSGLPQKEFIFIRLNVLREYLERELRIDGLPFPFDLDRAIDDWVFMCFFVGNDFLPHLPSLEIREGAIDRLIRLYKQVVPQTHGYLTHNGKVNLPRVQLILTELGKVEDEIFQRRRKNEQDFRRRQKQKKRRTMGNSPNWTPRGQFAPKPVGSGPSPIHNPRQEAYQMRMSATSSLASNQSAAGNLKEQLRGGVGGGSDDTSSKPHHQRSMSLPGDVPNGDLIPSRLGVKRKRENEDSDSEPEDNVRLWEHGWKERYYQNKFGVPSDDSEFVEGLAEQYTRGLCWVLGYYYQGCPSWKWFYPYHYAPFASDFKNIKNVRNDFDKGTVPFAPLEQLMGVFPASSGKFLPQSWRELMRKDDSPIIDFYPTNFRVDLNGKKWAWQGVALLPFVDEQRLLQSLSTVYQNLTPGEAERNSLGTDRIFVYQYNRLYPIFKMLYEKTGPEQQALEMNPEFANGMRGTLSCDQQMVRVCEMKGFVDSPVPSLRDIKKSCAICACYKDPQYPDNYIFEAKLLPTVKMPPRTLRPQGVLGPYRPQIGFSQREDPYKSYNTPDPAKRMIRHSIGGAGRGSHSDSRRSSSYGEYHSSQGENHGFRGAAGYEGYGSEMGGANYQGYGPPMGGASWGTPSSGDRWNSPSHYEQGQRGSGYDRRASGGYGAADGGQSSWRSGEYGGQWSGGQDYHQSPQDYHQGPWRSQSGPSHSHWTPLPPPSSHSAHYAMPPSHHQRRNSHETFFPQPSTPDSGRRGHAHQRDPR